MATLRDRATLRYTIEAMRLLTILVDGADIVGDRDGRITLTVDLPADTFERLCLWGGDAAEIEAEPDSEPQGDDEDSAQQPVGVTDIAPPRAVATTATPAARARLPYLPEVAAYVRAAR